MCFYTYKNILILVKNLLKLVDSAHEKLLRSFLLNYRTRINLNGDCYKCIVWRAWFGAVIYINNTNYDACRWSFFQYRVIVVTYELNFIFCKEKSKRTRDFTTPLDHRLHPHFIRAGKWRAHCTHIHVDESSKVLRRTRKCSLRWCSLLYTVDDCFNTLAV